MERVSVILGRAFDILQHDHAAAYFRVTDELEGLTVGMVVDGESFAARSKSGRMQILDPDTAGDVSASTVTTRRTVLDLCDGQIRLLEAVMAGRLQVRAREGDLLRMSRAVTAFSEGAVRARRMRALLEDFRAQLPLV